MKSISPHALYQQFRARGMSMRRRFVLCLLLVLFTVLLLLLLLNVFGVIHPAEDELAQTLTQQLDYSADQISSSMEHLAAQALSLSETLQSLVEDTGVPFDELEGDQEALLALQMAAYAPLCDHMRRSNCSGAFYFLNTTVNDTLEDTYYNGIYLKYANLSSDTTVRNSVRMYRGSAHVARENGIKLHSTWENETQEGTFPQLEAVMRPKLGESAAKYLLTTVYKLPDTWERVRFLCVPVKDAQGRVLGVCGYEISDLYFQFSYQTADGELSHAVCALLTEDDSGYAGQVAGNRSGYAPDLDGSLTVSQQGQFSLVSNARSSFVGRMKDVDIGQSRHMVAALLPDSIYSTSVHQQQSKTILLLVTVSVLAVGLSIVMGRQYVTPLLRSMEQVKNAQFDSSDSRIPEVNELFDYLAQRDRINESMLDELRREQVDTQASLAHLQTEHDRLQDRLQQLAQSKKDEVYPEEYTYFQQGIEDLSEKERAVFDCYLKDMTTKESAATLGISEDGVRYHNKNIYAKLGVKGLKQLRMFISIMQQDKGQNAPEL